MTFEFSVPTRIIFGKGAFRKVGEIVKTYGSSPIIVAGRNSMSHYRYLNVLLELLTESQLKPIVFSGISSNPKAEEVNRAVDVIRENKCDFVIGLGGGSAMDAAKAAAVGINYSSIEEIIGKAVHPDYSLPIVTIPTTAGSGAEVTKGAIITDPKRRVKLGIRGVSLSPKVAIVDPELTYTLPEKVTAETGFDALTHSIEPYIANMANPATDVLSLEAIKIISRHLEDATHGDIDAREKMSLAALLGGINVYNASSCLPHRLQQAMGSIIDISHGAGLAAVYPSWWNIALSHAQEKLGTIENLFIQSGYESTFEFMQRISVNYRLRDLGIRREQIPKFVEKIEGNLENDPIPNINRDLIKRIYEESY